VVEYFFDHKVDFSPIVNKLLSIAACADAIEVARFLLSSGADVKAKNNAALNSAVIGRRAGMIRFLQDNGAVATPEITKVVQNCGCLDLL
jgi:hypothetical protein